MEFSIYADGEDQLPTYGRFTTRDGRDLTISLGGGVAPTWSDSEEPRRFDDTYADVRDGNTHLLRLCRDGSGNHEARVLAHGLIVVLKAGDPDPLNGECVVLSIEEE